MSDGTTGDPSADTRTPAPSPARADAKPAALWRRALAFAADTTLLGVIGYGIGTVLFDVMIALGPVTRLIGLGLAVAYFAVSDSVLMDGRSLGKRALRIKVVGRDGAPLSVFQAAERALILMTPILLNEFPTGKTSLVVTVGWSVTFLGLGSALLYLVIFNASTRQSLHDLAVGAVVIPDGGAVPVTKPLKLGHWFAIVALAACSVVAGLLIPGAMTRGRAGELLTVREALLPVPGARDAIVIRTEVSRPETKNTEQVLAVTVFYKRMPADPEATAREIAGLIVTRFPEVVGTDRLIVNVAVGFNLGIANYVRQHRLETFVNTWPKYEYHPA